jgi:aspartate aminotransferase-like enzyme
MTGDSAAPVFTLTPGPAGATPATLAALSQPILRYRDPVFLAVYAETGDRRVAGRALRRAGAAADAGAAVEAARGELPCE